MDLWLLRIAPPLGPTCVDAAMSQVSDPRKRPISGSSSDDGLVVDSKNSQSLSKKAKKTVVDDPKSKDVVNDAGSKRVVSDVGSRRAAASEVVSRRNVSSCAFVVPAKKGGGVAKKVGAVAAAALPRGSECSPSRCCLSCSFGYSPLVQKVVIFYS